MDDTVRGGDMAKGTCSVEGCNRSINKFGLCRMHRWRLETYGDVNRTGSGLVGLESSRPQGQTIEQRFMARIVVNETTGCWEWQGARDPNGYGRINIGDHKTMTTHRLSWVIHHGEPPPETPFVLHHCDNPCCCNPFGDDHLFLGTQADNVADMMSKNRGPAQAPHGTMSGYRRHIRRKEKPCDACALASLEYQREQRIRLRKPRDVG